MLDYFDSIFCLNLATRPDRWEAFLQEAVKLPGQPEIIRWLGWPADGGYTERSISASNSHFQAIQRAKAAGLKNVLIFEDDVEFHNLEHLPAVIEQLSKTEWDLFYLGANVCNRITPEGEHLGRLSHAQAQHAYAVNWHFYDRVLSLWPRVLAREREMDCLLAYEVVPSCRAYIARPMIATQRAGYSNINQRFENYNDWMFQRYDAALRMGEDT